MLATNDHAAATNDRIRQFVFEKFPACQKKEFTDQESLIESGVIDSMGMLEMVAFVEADFGIEVQDTELTPENFESIEALATFVDSKKGH